MTSLDLAIWMMGNPKPVAVSGATYCKFANTELSDSEHSQFGDKKSGGTFDVDVVNVLNTNVPWNITYDSGTSFGLEDSISSPRAGRIAVVFEF